MVRTRAGRAPPPDAPPRDPPESVGLVEPLALVAAHARRQDAPPPTPTRPPIESGELAHDLGDPARALELVLVVDVLPRGQEA